MRWMVAIPVLLALAMALTGPALAQELRIFENMTLEPVITPPPVATNVVPPPVPQQTTVLDDRGLR
ncbi:MAG: hypothetical protein ACRDGN_04480 [bacterium]